MVAVENLYIVKNGNGTLDTMVCSDLRMVKAVAGACGGTRGGVEDLTQVPVYERIDMDSTEFKFPYCSMN